MGGRDTLAGGVEAVGPTAKILVVGSSTGRPSSLEPASEEMVEKLRGDDGSSLGDLGNGGVPKLSERSTDCCGTSLALSDVDVCASSAAP
jgi:hypothetical protein